MSNIKSLFVKIVLACALLFSGQACMDLEEDLSGIINLEDLSDERTIETALTSVYSQFSKLVERPHQFFHVCYGADDFTTWWGGNKAPLRVFDRFDYGNGENSDIPWLPIVWDECWKTIYYCNTIIDGLKESAAPEEVVKVADAEARFFRALSYLELVRRWGNMPIILDGMTPTGEEVRATVLANYQHIEDDLEIAEVNLPDPGATANVGRVSKAAAKTLFSTLYMTWAGWPIKDEAKYGLAAQKAKDVIDMGYFTLLPFDQLWLYENQNSLESVFSVNFSESEKIINWSPQHFSFHMARGWSDCYPELQFFYDFPEGLRKDITFYTEIPNRKVFAGQVVPNDPPTVPWEEAERFHPMYKKHNLGSDISQVLSGRMISFRAIEFFRYAEVLLLYAESAARANGGTATGEALEALNQVKRRAMGLPYDTPDVTVDVTTATADEIMQEKAWELAGELGKRWWDLVRTETVAQVARDRDPTEQVELVTTDITWKQYIAPIPVEAITTSDMVQNPQGFKAQ